MIGLDIKYDTYIDWALIVFVHLAKLTEEAVTETKKIGL